MPEQPFQVLQSAAFARAYKKLYKNQKVDVGTAVEVIVKAPEVVELKRGDLAGVYVYKFTSQNQLMLLAYEYDPHTRMLLLLGAMRIFIGI